MPMACHLERPRLNAEGSMTTTGNTIANGLQALPKTASKPASPHGGADQQDFADTLEQILEPGTSMTKKRVQTPDAVPANAQHSPAAKTALDGESNSGMIALAVILGAEPSAAFGALKPAVPAVLSSGTLSPSHSAAGAAATQAGLGRIHSENQKSRSQPQGTEVTAPGPASPADSADAANIDPDLHTAMNADLTQIGFALDGLQTLLSSGAMQAHEQQALKTALTQLEAAKSILVGAPSALSDGEAPTSPAPAISSVAQGTAAMSSITAATSRSEQPASIVATMDQKTSTGPGLAEGLGAANSGMELAQAFDVPLLNTEAPVARTPDLTPLPALASLLVHKLENGGGQIAVRLDPPELGRLDITLGFDDDGSVTAHIRADRPEALELMQREAKGLEQSLRQAGFTLDSNALSFSLNQGNRGQGGDTPAMPDRYRKNTAGVDAQPESRAQHLEIYLQSNRALDVRV